MNTVITSKEAIMQVCRRIVAEKGLTALNAYAASPDHLDRRN